MTPVVTAITNKIYTPLVVCKKQYGAVAQYQVDTLISPVVRVWYLVA